MPETLESIIKSWGDLQQNDAWISIKVTRQHLGLDLPKQTADQLLIQPEATGMAIAAGFKEQAAAQLGEGGSGAGIRQLSTGRDIPHHRIAIDGVGKAFPVRQVALRIRDQLLPELVVGEHRQPHTSMEQPRAAQQMLQIVQLLNALGVQLG